MLLYLAGLVRYLRAEQPHTLCSTTITTMNVRAWLAVRIAGMSTRLVVGEHNTLSKSKKFLVGGWRRRVFTSLVQHAYTASDAIITVSNGVADDLATSIGLNRKMIRTIYNTVMMTGLLIKA